METTKIPFYTKAAWVTIAAYGFIFALYLGQNIVMPIAYSTIIAISLNPLVNFLVRHRFN